METYKGDSQENYRSSGDLLINRQAKKDDTVITVKGIEIGGQNIIIIAGPCAVENREQLLETAKEVSAGGANILRGGAYKPRTSPYSFQGLGEDCLLYTSPSPRDRQRSRMPSSA